MSVTDFPISSLILNTFRELAQAGLPVDLFNHFHGLLISSPSQIISVDRNEIALKVEAYQAVCIFLEKQVLIQTDSSSVAIEAYPSQVDIPEKIVYLNRMTMTETSLDRRRTRRVQPKDPVAVKLFHDGCEITGQLADISPDGVGLFTFGAYFDQECKIQPGERVEMELFLPIVDKVLHVTGQTKNISSEGIPTMNRVGVYSTIDSATELLLLDYISLRQAEILLELENIYNRLLNEKGG